jgi:hypothetical protein
VSHAALPIPEQRPDGSMGAYVSARDAQGRARIGSVDISLEGGTPPAWSEEPVLDLGPLGAFDDSGVTGSCLVENGSDRYLYYSGWSLGVSVPFYFYAGCAVSAAGGPFERVSAAPILERTAVDPFLTASPWVLVESGLWRMWYVSATEWQPVDGKPRHRYLIKYAESEDGITWRRDGVVCVGFSHDDDYALGRPCVVREDGRYRMWFSHRGESYRIGYAESADGIVWDRLDDEAGLSGTPGDWDGEMQEYPAVFRRDGRLVCLYNGNGFGATGVGLAVAED